MTVGGELRNKRYRFAGRRPRHCSRSRPQPPAMHGTGGSAFGRGRSRCLLLQRSRRTDVGDASSRRPAHHTQVGTHDEWWPTGSDRFEEVLPHALAAANSDSDGTPKQTPTLDASVDFPLFGLPALPALASRISRAVKRRTPYGRDARGRRRNLQSPTQASYFSYGPVTLAGRRESPETDSEAARTFIRLDARLRPRSLIAVLRTRRGRSSRERLQARGRWRKLVEISRAVPMAVTSASAPIARPMRISRIDLRLKLCPNHGSVGLILVSWVGCQRASRLPAGNRRESE